jgi:hypothetical protein
MSDQRAEALGLEVGGDGVPPFLSKGVGGAPEG